jgi:DNA (cytosine-5)-methyltransferase 1
MTMKLGSLFDGSGTAPLAASILGWSPVWASEIEPYPVAVTNARFPSLKHMGDITQINGAEIEPVDVIAGGSPCQDLSIAGKQAGLTGGNKSHLFFQMTRIVREMRDATNGKYPRFVVWENVPGAFSSNQGKDFLAVVEAFCAIANDRVSIPAPERDRTGQLVWRNAGAVVGAGWSFAWRVVDAQYWGVPQRRRRIYAVLDLGAERAGEILFERTRLPRDPEPRAAAQEADSSNAVGSVDRSGRDGDGLTSPAIWHTMTSLNARCVESAQQINAVAYPTGPVGALCARADSSPCVDRGQPFVAFAQNERDEVRDLGDHTGALSANAGMKQQTYIALFEPKSAKEENWAQSEAKNALRADASKSSHAAIAIQGNIARGAQLGQNGAGYIDDGSAYTLNTIDTHAVCMRSNIIGRGDQSGCDGNGCVEDVAYTVDTKEPHAVAYGIDARNGALNDELLPTMQAKENGGQSLNYMPPVLLESAQANAAITEGIAPCLNASHERPILCDKNRVIGFQSSQSGIRLCDTHATIDANNGARRQNGVVVPGKPPRRYIVRRLIPLECCRLQGFPDFWTDGVPGSDSAQYKMWGNGMALPNMLAVLNGIDTLQKEAER